MVPQDGQDPCRFMPPYRNPEGCIAYTWIDLLGLPMIIQPSRGWRLTEIDIEHAAYFKSLEDMYMLWAQDNWIRDPNLDWRR